MLPVPVISFELIFKSLPRPFEKISTSLISDIAPSAFTVIWGTNLASPYVPCVTSDPPWIVISTVLVEVL